MSCPSALKVLCWGGQLMDLQHRFYLHSQMFGPKITSISPHSIQCNLPLELVTQEVFTQWMQIFQTVVDRPVPEVSEWHRYRLEIPEPAPSLSQHGLQLEVFRFLPLIKITMIRQVHMYYGLSTKINTNTAWCTKIMNAFCVHSFLRV